MRLPRAAVRPVIGDAIYGSIAGQGSAPVAVEAESLLFDYRFQVFKLRDHFEPATFAEGYIAQEYTVAD